MDIKARFESKRDSSGGDKACWPWNAARDRAGYGIFQLFSRAVKAHRVAMCMKTGVWPTMDVLHGCGNTWCCNPSHLREGTALENAMDRSLHGRDCVGEKNGNVSLSDNDVDRLRVERTKGTSMASLAKSFGIGETQVKRILDGVHRGKNEYVYERSIVDLSGATFGRLLVLNRASKDTRLYSSEWNCVCECGVRVENAKGSLLMTGKKKSCGCLRIDMAAERSAAANAASVEHFRIKRSNKGGLLP